MTSNRKLISSQPLSSHALLLTHFFYCQFCNCRLRPNLMYRLEVILTILSMIQCSLYNNYLDAYLMVISFSHFLPSTSTYNVTTPS